jgi:hypothetical protein
VPVWSTYRHHRIRRVHFRLKALSQNGSLGIEKLGAKIGKFPSADTGQLTAWGNRRDLAPFWLMMRLLIYRFDIR